MLAHRAILRCREPCFQVLLVQLLILHMSEQERREVHNDIGVYFSVNAAIPVPDNLIPYRAISCLRCQSTPL